VFKGTSLNVISTKNELKVWNKIIGLVNLSLEKYDTGLEVDEGLLEMDDKEHNLTSNERNCLLYRIGEKQILHFLLSAAEQIIPLISMNYRDARKEVTKYKNFGNCQEYVRNFILPHCEKNNS
jgi:protein-histidine N-methyltransferase